MKSKFVRVAALILALVLLVAPVTAAVAAPAAPVAAPLTPAAFSIGTVAPLRSFALTLVVLPDVVKGALVALVGFLFAFILQQVALYWPWLASYLGPYKDQVVTGVSAALIAWIETQLNLFPAYEPLINGALAFLVIVIMFFGLPFLTFKYLQRRGVRAFRATR